MIRLIVKNTLIYYNTDNQPSNENSYMCYDTAKEKAQKISGEKIPDDLFGDASKDFALYYNSDDAVKILMWGFRNDLVADPLHCEKGYTILEVNGKQTWKKEIEQ